MPYKPAHAKKGTEPKEKRQKPTGEALMTSAELYRETGYGHAAISEMQSNGTIQQIKRGVWPMKATLGALVRKLRAKNEGGEDRARKNRLDADSSELDVIARSKEFCSIAEAKQFWGDSRIEFRQLIERAEYLTSDQRTKLLTQIAALKDRELETDK